MIPKDFWSNAKVACIGAGSWGTVLAQLVSANVREVRLYARDEALGRAVNATRINETYAPGMKLNPNITVYSDYTRLFAGSVQLVIFALPAKVMRDEAKRIAPFLNGSEVILHATKGIEHETLKRMSEVLAEELPCPRIGVISGPNLAHEIAQGQPAGTVVASRFPEVVEAGKLTLTHPNFQVYGADDVVGVEWAGVLKNILAIASGAIDAVSLGWNARSMLIASGLGEMARFGVSLGAKPESFLGVAGVGDLLATCSSSLSRNYRVGFRLAKGESLAEVLKDLGFTAEGVRTTRTVHEFARLRGIQMPIVETMNGLLNGSIQVPAAVQWLMQHAGD